MTTKTKTPTKIPSFEEATSPMRTIAKAFIDLGSEQAQGYERLMRAQLGHVTQSTRDMTEFMGTLAKTTLDASEAARRQSFEFATKTFAEA